MAAVNDRGAWRGQFTDGGGGQRKRAFDRKFDRFARYFEITVLSRLPRVNGITERTFDVTVHPNRNALGRVCESAVISIAKLFREIVQRSDDNND